MDFASVREQLYELYHAGSHAEAADLVTQEAAKHPQHANELGYWRLCLANLLGDRQLALQILTDAVADGRWYSLRMLRQDPDLATLQGDPEFERLVEACEGLRNAAQETVEARRLTVVPHKASPTTALPLLVALHGNGSRAEAERTHWLSATKQGWLLTLPQSSQVETPDGFSWWDRDWAVREVLRHVDEVAAERLVQPDRIVIGGFSAGAGLAMRLALGGELAARGFIAVAPALQRPEEIRSLLQANVPARLRGYLIVGGQDQRSCELAQTAKSLLESYGIPCELETHPKMGHTFPRAFRPILDRALRCIMSPVP